MQHLTVQKVKWIIELAKKANPPESGGSITIGKGGMDVDDVVALMDKEASPAEKALLNALETLSREEMAELEAVMWIGRGEHSPAAFDDLVKHAIASHDEGDAFYVAGKSPLARYLRDGLHKLGLSA